jgi:hypothetical protein
MAVRDYDGTIARIAGNIASGMLTQDDAIDEGTRVFIAKTAVTLAREIVAEVKRTTPTEG